MVLQGSIGRAYRFFGSKDLKSPAALGGHAGEVLNLDSFLVRTSPVCFFALDVVFHGKLANDLGCNAASVPRLSQGIFQPGDRGGEPLIQVGEVVWVNLGVFVPGGCIVGYVDRLVLGRIDLGGRASRFRRGRGLLLQCKGRAKEASRLAKLRACG